MTKQQQILILVLFLAGGGIFGYFNYLLNPTLAQIKERESKLADLTKKIEEAQRVAKRLPALTAEKERLEIELAALEKQLPTDKDVPSIIRTLTREALQENLEFNRLVPSGAQRRTYFEIIPFDVQFTCTLHSLARFLAALGQQERIFQVQNITLRPTGGNFEKTGIVTLTATFVIQTYAYIGNI